MAESLSDKFDLDEVAPGKKKVKGNVQILESWTLKKSRFKKKKLRGIL